MITKLIFFISGESDEARCQETKAVLNMLNRASRGPKKAALDGLKYTVRIIRHANTALSDVQHFRCVLLYTTTNALYVMFSVTPVHSVALMRLEISQNLACHAENLLILSILRMSLRIAVRPGHENVSCSVL